MMQVPEPVRRFWRETIAPRPIAAGSAAAIAAGLAVGAYLASGAGFEPPPPMKPAPPGAARRLEATPQPITFMKGADGRTPDWVIGTDNIPGRKVTRSPVLTVPDDEDVAEAPRGRGFGWLLPWRWGRGEGRQAEPPRPSRRIESDREAERRAEREQERRDRYFEDRERERYAEERARERYERYDRYDRYAEAEEDYPPREREPRYRRRYEPPPEPPWWEDEREPIPPPFRGR